MTLSFCTMLFLIYLIRPELMKNIVFIFALLFFMVCSGCMPLKGDQGAPGASIQGPPGHTPVVTVIAATPLQCVNGGQQVLVDGTLQGVTCNGATGSTGDVGNTGPVGPAGQNGTPGTVIAPVKFCPESPSYGTFPEYGVCISNQLYAVYSANGGFLALISPGRYSSDGINSACSFTVGTNCEITR